MQPPACTNDEVYFLPSKYHPATFNEKGFLNYHLPYPYHIRTSGVGDANYLRGDKMRHRLSVLALVFTAVALLWICVGSETAYAKTVAEWDSGFLNIDYQVQARAAWRDQGTDPSQDQTSRDLYLRRNRLSFLGAATETIGYAIQFEYNGGRRIGDLSVSEQNGEYDSLILDYYLTWDPSDSLKFRVGKTKHVLTREVNEGCFDPLSIDRSNFILGPFSGSRPEKTTRDYGLVAWGNFVENKLQYRLAVMQGNDFGSNKPDDIGYRYTGRVHLTLLDPEAGLGYKGTYLGKKNVLTLGAGYEVQPNAVFASGTTGPAEDYKGLTYDIFYEKPTDMGTFTVSGAYYEMDFNRASGPGAEDRNGSYWKAGYMVGKTQIFGRFEDWAFVSGQSLKLQVAGVNYYIKGQDLRLTLEYTATDLKNENAKNKDFTTILAQFQARF